jgi:hypothetical protein
MISQCSLTATTASEENSESNSRDRQPIRATEHQGSKPVHNDIRFWGIMSAMCMATLLGGLETTIVTTSLPTIVHELGIGNEYVWINNALFLAR